KNIIVEHIGLHLLTGAVAIGTISTTRNGVDACKLRHIQWRNYLAGNVFIGYLTEHGNIANTKLYPTPIGLAVFAYGMRQVVVQRPHIIKNIFTTDRISSGCVFSFLNKILML